MRFIQRSNDPRLAHGATVALLAAVLATSGTLVGGASSSADARKLPGKRGLIATAAIDWGSAKPGQGATGQVRANGLFQATQTGPTSRKGTRPMAIIAVLIGLKAERNYALAFSKKRCPEGAGGLVGTFRFRASSAGEAAVKRKYRLKRKALRRSKSVVLLSPKTGRRFLSCGRLVVGDFNMDGNVDDTDR